MAGQGLAQLPGPVPVAYIPQPDRLVLAGRGQGAPIGGKRPPVHRVGVAGQGLAQLPGPVSVADIPQLDGLVVADGGQGAPVRVQR